MPIALPRPLEMNIKAARPADMAAHRGKPDRKQQIEQPGQQEGARHARPVAQRESGGRRADHRRQRRRRRDHEEHDMRQSERVFREAPVFCACCIAHYAFPNLA
jgi:hypothetical protein